MPHEHDIPNGTLVTLSPNQRRVAGYWSENLDDFSTVWTDRIAHAVENDHADIVAIGEIDRASTILLDDHQKIQWSKNARLEYDPDTDAVSATGLNVPSKSDKGHAIGGDDHSADTLANLNSKIEDATLDDTSTARPPETHDNASHSTDYAADGHAIGGTAHASDTLANLNSKVSDATLDDASATRPPETHGNSVHSTNYSAQGHDHSGEAISPDAMSVGTLNNAVQVTSGDDIQTKIDSAPVNGTVVFDPSTTLTTSSSISITTAGLTLVTPHIEATAEVGDLVSVTAADVTIRGGHLNGADLARRGIFTNADNTIVDEVTLENFSESVSGNAPCAVRLHNAYNGVVKDCTIRSVSAPQTTISRGVVTSGTSAGGVLKIINNTIEDVTPVADADGVVIGGAWTRAIVTGNTVEDCHKRAFKVQPQAPGLTLLADNSCYYSLTTPDPFCAIGIQQDNVIVADNIVDYETCNTALIQLQGDDVSVTGNNLTVRNPGTGLDGVNTTTEQHGVSVANNTIDGVSRDGVRFADGTTNSTIVGNVIRAPGRYGVMVNDNVIAPDSVTVGNNVIDGSGDHGIILYSATNTSVTGNSGSAAGDFINLFGGDVEIGHNAGYVTQDSGSYTTSGDGSATFSIPHGVEKAPSSITVTPTSQDAAGEFWVSNRTYSSFDITYTTAPPSGTDNLSWEWAVEEEL